jgi:membrane-bound lytic murein transglycosylase
VTIFTSISYYSRKAIDEGALDERSLEMLYLKDPVVTYFLHIQGSGIIQLDDGTTVRVGYAESCTMRISHVSLLKLARSIQSKAPIYHLE